MLHFVEERWIVYLSKLFILSILSIFLTIYFLCISCQKVTFSHKNDAKLNLQNFATLIFAIVASIDQNPKLPRNFFLSSSMSSWYLNKEWPKSSNDKNHDHATMFLSQNYKMYGITLRQSQLLLMDKVVTDINTSVRKIFRKYWLIQIDQNSWLSFELREKKYKNNKYFRGDLFYLFSSTISWIYHSNEHLCHWDTHFPH